MTDRFALYLRSTIFGIIDSLVSTVGLLAGIGIAGVPRNVVILTGIVYAFVEGFSMAVGDFLSEKSAEEYDRKTAVKDESPLFAGAIMFFAFVLAAFIPIVPYLLWAGVTALIASVVLSLATLLVVGAVSGSLARLPLVPRALRMALLGGAAIAIGLVVGWLVPAV